MLRNLIVFFVQWLNIEKININIEEKEVQSKVEELYNYMNKYAFDCSVEVFSYIGKGYSQNPEFKNNIDKFGEGGSWIYF